MIVDFCLLLKRNFWHVIKGLTLLEFLNCFNFNGMSAIHIVYFYILFIFFVIRISKKERKLSRSFAWQMKNVRLSRDIWANKRKIENESSNYYDFDIVLLLLLTH